MAFSLCAHCGTAQDFDQAGFVVPHGCARAPLVAIGDADELPKQLACVLRDPAERVAAFTQLAPGIPASKEVIADMFRTLKTEDIVATTRDVPEVAQFVTIICRVFKKKEIIGLQAVVRCYAGKSTPGVEMPYAKLREFEFTTAGTLAAMLYLQEEVNYIKKRGFCPDCLAGRYPVKRIKIQGGGACASCVLGKTVF